MIFGTAAVIALCGATFGVAAASGRRDSYRTAYVHRDVFVHRDVHYFHAELRRYRFHVQLRYRRYRPAARRHYRSAFARRRHRAAATARPYTFVESITPLPPAGRQDGHGSPAAYTDPTHLAGHAANAKAPAGPKPAANHKAQPGQAKTLHELTLVAAIARAIQAPALAPELASGLTPATAAPATTAQAATPAARTQALVVARAAQLDRLEAQSTRTFARAVLTGTVTPDVAALEHAGLTPAAFQAAVTTAADLPKNLAALPTRTLPAADLPRSVDPGAGAALPVLRTAPALTLTGRGTLATGLTGTPLLDRTATLDRLAPETAEIRAATAATAPRPASGAPKRASTAHPGGAFLFPGVPAPPVIQSFVGVVPPSVWAALAGALALAALGGGAAVLTGRRARRQAGRIAEVEAAALTDPLTGVLNRRGFTEALERELARSRRYGRSFVLAYVDVRGLKAVNDSHGHLAGDALLREVATLLRSSARADDVVGRLGGDEFGLVLVEQSADSATAVTERIHDQVAARHAALGDDPRWDLTIGTATWPQDGGTAEDLLAEADRRLYEQRGIALRLG